MINCMLTLLVVVGVAGWYGPGFEGQPARNGKIFDSSKFTFAANYIDDNEIPDGLPYMVCTGKPVLAWWPHLGGWFVLDDVPPRCIVARWTDTGSFGKWNRKVDLSKAAFIALTGNEHIGLINVYVIKLPPPFLNYS